MHATAAGLDRDETVYDLYCGTGTIGLALAPSAASVWGVEISEESVACAIENAELNGIANARFFAGNVGQSLEELREHAGPPDVVVVDPPRAGLAGKALRRTGALQAPRLVYVSCNPTTLASDLAVLRDEYGYRLERCTPVDMFPHTPHIESVSLLQLTDDTAEGQRDRQPRAGGSDRRDEGGRMKGRRIAVLTARGARAGCGGMWRRRRQRGVRRHRRRRSSRTPTRRPSPTTSATETEDATDASGALTGECAEFAGLSAKLSQAFAGSSSDLDSATEVLDQFADQVPEEIRDDYEVLAKNLKEFADELKDLGLASGETPSPEDIAKLQEITQSLDSAEVREASQNIEAWAQANC